VSEAHRLPALTDAAPRAAAPDWQADVAPFRSSSSARSVLQLASTFAVLIAVWALAYGALTISPWLALATDVLVAGVLVRLFILQHDCGHGSFFASERANRLVGGLTSIFTATPYGPWRRDHSIHHAVTGNLDRRGVGDITTWTAAEYRDATAWRRLGYRAGRNPFVMLVLGPLGVFLIGQRFPRFFSRDPTRSDRWSVHLTTLGVIALWASLWLAFGWKAVLLVHLPAVWLAGSAGIFLFYVQHQYPRPYWRHAEAWSYKDACLRGSSHLQLGRLLGWFSGDIGVHHIHHLAPRIPNYKLRACLAANPHLQAENALTLWRALLTLRLHLYDEESGRLIGFRAATSAPAASARRSWTTRGCGTARPGRR
jgi:omega-6 fatty acid desaturase (delta-12 desaturase)